jgi:lactoylglutathione lyase
MKSILVVTSLIIASASISFAQGFKKMQIDHKAISVVDLKQTRNFYCGVLGLDTIPEPFKDGKHLWLDLGGNISLHVISGAPKPIEHYQNDHLCLRTDNVVGFTKLLESKKIGWYDVKGVPNKMTTRPDGVQQVWIKDPDGYWVEVNNVGK